VSILVALRKSEVRKIPVSCLPINLFSFSCVIFVSILHNCGRKFNLLLMSKYPARTEIITRQPFTALYILGVKYLTGVEATNDSLLAVS
jgi:hypothetical protein